MIVHDTAWEQSLGYDQAFLFSVSDWSTTPICIHHAILTSFRYHEQMPYLLHDFLDGSTFGGHTFKGQMPMPVSSLINDTQSITLNIEPKKIYLLRMVSVAALFPHTVYFGELYQLQLEAAS
jgi:hypothetical protein